MNDSTSEESPRTPNDDDACKENCADCSECPRCKETLAKRSPTRSVEDFKVTKSRVSSKGTNVTAQKEEEKKKGTDTAQGTDECKRDSERKEKEDPLVKWFPDHISKDPLLHPLIPYPHPAEKVELRGGNFIHMCQCLKRDGLQSDCKFTGCQGGHDCMQRFLPDCIPSGLRLPGKPPSYLQKADQPECYSKTELVKGYDRVMNETLTGGTGGIEGDKEVKPKSKGPEIKKPPSITSLISEESKGDEEIEKKPVRIRPNSPPNYISEPSVFTYPAPCRRHATRGIPGSGKYEKYARCRLRKGKTLPKVIAPPRSRENSIFD